MKLYISFFVILLVTIYEVQLEDNNPTSDTAPTVIGGSTDLQSTADPKCGEDVGMSEETWDTCGLSKLIKEEQNMTSELFCIEAREDLECVHFLVERKCKSKESAKKFIQSNIVLADVKDKIDRDVPECQSLMEYVKNGDIATTTHVTDGSTDPPSTADPTKCGYEESQNKETREKCGLDRLMKEYADMTPVKFCSDGYKSLTCVHDEIIEKCKPEPTKLFIQSLEKLLMSFVKNKINMSVPECRTLMDYLKDGGVDFPAIPGITMINTPADLPTEPVTRNCTNNGAEVTETTEGINNHTDGPPHTDITETDGHNYAASTRPSWLQKLIMTAASCLAFRAARK